MFTPPQLPNPFPNLLGDIENLIKKSTNYIVFFFISVLNLLIPLGLLFIIVRYERYNAILVLILVPIYGKIFGSSTSLIGSSSGVFVWRTLTLTFMYIGSIVLNLAALYYFNNGSLLVSLSLLALVVLMTFSAWAMTNSQIPQLELEQNLEFWDFFRLYKIYIAYQRSTEFSALKELHSGYLEDNISNILLLDKMLQVFQLSDCTNQAILSGLCKELEILFLEYFDAEIDLSQKYNIKEISEVKVKVEKYKYITIIDYLTRNKKLLKFFMRANIFRTIIDNQITDLNLVAEKDMFRHFGFIPNIALLKARDSETTLNDRNLRRDAFFNLNLGNIASSILYFLSNPRNEERLFVTNSNNKTDYPDFFRLCRFPYIKSITSRGVTVLKTLIDENYYFRGSVPSYDPNSLKQENYYYYLIDDTQSCAQIMTILEEIKDELIKEMINSVESSNSTQMQFYIYELLTAGQVKLHTSERRLGINELFAIDTSKGQALQNEKIFASIVKALQMPPIFRDSIFRSGVDKEKTLLWFSVLTKAGQLLNEFKDGNHTINIKGNSYTIKFTKEPIFIALQKSIDDFVSIRQWSTDATLRAKENARKKFNFCLKEVLSYQKIKFDTMPEWQFYFTQRVPEFSVSETLTYEVKIRGSNTKVNISFSQTDDLYKIDQGQDTNIVSYYLRKNMPQEEGAPLQLEGAIKEYMKLCEYFINNEPKLCKAYQALITAISDNISSVSTDEIEQNLANLLGSGALQKPYTTMEYYSNPGIYPLCRLSSIYNETIEDPLKGDKLIINDAQLTLQDDNYPVYAQPVKYEDILNREFVIMYHAINNNLLYENTYSKASQTIYAPRIRSKEALIALKIEAVKMLDKLLLVEPNLSNDAIFRGAKECYAYGRTILEIERRSPGQMDAIYKIYGNYYMITKCKKMFVNFDNFISQYSTLQYVFNIHDDKFELNQKKLDSNEVREYIEHQSDLYKIKMIMDTVWFIAFIDDHSLNVANVDIFCNLYLEANKKLTSFTDFIELYHRNYFSSALEKTTIEFIQKYTNVFRKKNDSKVFNEQSLEGKIKMMSQAYIPEYIRLLPIIMSMKNGNISYYVDYYKYSLKEALLEQAKHRFSEMSDNDYLQVKRLYIRDPIRFIPNSLTRFIFQSYGENVITPLNLELVDLIAKSYINHADSTFVISNINPWSALNRITE